MAFALFITSIFYNVIVTYSLQQKGFDYAVDYISMGKIMTITVSTILLIFYFVSQESLLSSMIYNIFLTGLAFVLMTWLIQPFTSDEREKIFQIIPPKIRVLLQGYLGKYSPNAPN